MIKFDVVKRRELCDPSPRPIPIGGSQSLSATFTPQDLADLTNAATTTSTTIDKATPALKLSDSAGAYDSSRFPASVAIVASGADNSPATSV